MVMDFKDTGQRLFLLLLAGLGLALVVRLLQPPRPEVILKAETAISVAAFEALEPRPLVVDARSASAYVDGHIPGALHLSLDDWDRGLGELLFRWEPGQVVVVYCAQAGCGDSYAVAVRLRQEYELTETYHLKGGWEAWQQDVQE